jgi:ADP-heptose:LPS heptosyltransferase
MLPLLQSLRRTHPAALLHFAGVVEFAELFAVHGIVDRVHSVEDFALWNVERARQGVAEFDRVIGDVPEVAHAVLDPTGLTAGVPAGLQLARQIGLEPRWPEDGWLLPPSVDARGPIVFAPGSGGRSKCWPQQRWLELARALAPQRLQCAVGPTEVERDDPRTWSWPDSIEFLADRSVVELAAALRRASGFVGNDSGTTHLAAVLGLPTVAIFGPTNPAVWAPVGDHVRVVGERGRALSAIDPAEVLRALAAVRGRAEPASGFGRSGDPCPKA